MHKDTNTQEFVYIVGRQQLSVAGVVRSRGRQFTGVDDKRGKEFHKNLK